MLRIPLQRFAQFATGRIRRGGHDSAFQSDEYVEPMTNSIHEVLLTEAPLEAPKSDTNGAGAVADFWGVVRKLEDGCEIDGIDYEAHRQMAEHQLKKIAAEAAEIFRLQIVLIHHRIGFVAVAEPSLFVRVTALHRQETFQAMQWIVDELKQKVPIWKKPRFKLDQQPDAAHRAAATI